MIPIIPLGKIGRLRLQSSMTIQDPLSKFRITGGTESANADDKAALPLYLAHNSKDKIRYLQIKQSLEHRSPAYDYLLDVITDADRGREIALIFSFMLVKIRGKNLQEVATSLMRRHCEFIQIYDAECFSLSRKANEPIIESIEIVAGSIGGNAQNPSVAV